MTDPGIWNSGVDKDSIILQLKNQQTGEIATCNVTSAIKGDSFEITFNNDLPAGNYELSISIADKRGNRTGTITTSFIVVAPAQKTVFGFYNCPNPFSLNERTEIGYTLNLPSRVTINIYDLSGDMVFSIDCGEKKEGQNKEFWNGLNSAGEKLPNGVYFCELVVVESVSGAEHRKYWKMAIYTK